MAIKTDKTSTITVYLKELGGIVCKDAVKANVIGDFYVVQTLTETLRFPRFEIQMIREKHDV